MLVWEGRQHDCNHDSQVRSAASDFSSAPTCRAAYVYDAYMYDSVRFCMITIGLQVFI